MEAHLDRCDDLSERQFVLAVKRLATSLSYGTDASPHFGSGIEYIQSRLYQPGDPVKSIDWRLTGRTGKVYVKEYEAPRQTPVYLLLDTSASMCVGSRRMSKYAIGVQLAGGLALAAISRISPAGIIGCGSRALGVQPTLSRVQVFLWLHSLRRYRFDEQTTVGKRLQELASMLRLRSLVIVISDMHDPEAIPALKRIAQEHDCVVLQTRDPAEDGRLRAGFFRGEEAESGRAFTGKGKTQWFEDDPIGRDLKRAGVDHLVLRIDKPFLAKLKGFLLRRDSLGKGTR